MRVATLVHEIWEKVDGPGSMMLCLAGPRGDSARSTLGEGARCVHRFEAGSWFEAMRVYHRYNGWGEYKPDPAWVDEPYPDDRALE